MNTFVTVGTHPQQFNQLLKKIDELLEKGILKGNVFCQSGYSTYKPKNFKAKDFALFHPGGALGKRLLLNVEDIMRPRAKTPVVKKDAKVKDVLLKITKMRAGSACIVDGNGKLLGIFTDGDLRRHLDVGTNIMDCKIQDVMTRGPYTIAPDKLAAEAFKILRDRKIDEIPVVDKKGKLAGVLDVQDVLNAGLV